jgi:fibronectin type 3 domain-containing protein
MDQVEKIVSDEISISLIDLPDENYYDMYENDYSPQQVATIVINNANAFFDAILVRPKNIDFIDTLAI